ncbi:MAG: hypothetical protein Q9190_003274 [Brigantiaea leucoxantha]
MEDIFRFAAENSKSQAKTEHKADDELLSLLLRLRLDGRWDSQIFRQGVQTLLSFSLIGQESSRGRYFMHRLVHLWAYDRLTVAEKGRFCDQARDILKRSIAWRFASSDYTFRRDLLSHITTAQRLSNLSSMIFQKEGIAEFALAFSEAGRWKEAEELDVQVMETRKRVLGEEHPHTLTNIANLASTYWNQGRWKEAEELDVQVMETRKRVLGEEHPYTLSSMSNLAFTLNYQNRNKEAISLMERCFELRKQILGPKHPDTETSLEALYQWQDSEDEDQHLY